jgi:hypothetical protein
MKLKTRCFLEECTEFKELDASNKGYTARANLACKDADFFVGTTMAILRINLR